MGSKNRIAKDILPIMLKNAVENNINTWVEPFVGGGNIIDKVPDNFRRIGYDYNEHAIQALIAIRDMAKDLPEKVSEEDYKGLLKLPPSPISSWVRFVCSFGGKFEAGYARCIGSDDTTYVLRGKRNAIKQQDGLFGVELVHSNYKDITIMDKSIIYCDPPYQGTTGYSKTINHAEFWEWSRNKVNEGHVVFVSEYNAPNDFIPVWEGKLKTSFDSNRSSGKMATEKLFIHRTQL